MTNNNVSPEQWVSIGKNSPGISAVVSQVYNESNIEVVYLDSKNQAINEDAIWSVDHWKFKHQGLCGGYADKSDRLRRSVGILRAGRSH